VTRNDLDQYQPVATAIVHDNVGHLAVLRKHDIERGEVGSIEVSPLVTRVAKVKQGSAWRKTRTEVVNDTPCEFGVCTR
jgi:hypothetical protein